MTAKKNTQVLIAENNYLVGEMVKGLLIKLGYNVIGKAADGLQAVKMTSQLKPDVVVMDIKMPDMDGIEATRRIYECCPAPVVMLTAFEDQELVEQASSAGAGAYLVKPAKAPELERAITIATARFKDMVQLRHMNAKLKMLNEALKMQNAELDSFAHTVAHDLKNPLQLMLGYTTTLEKDNTLKPPLAEIPTILAQSARKMNSIIEELLILSGVRKAEVIPEPMEMADIVASAQERVVDMIEGYDAEIILPNDWPHSMGYGPWIEEVWMNYLSNGLKYGGKPPRLELGHDIVDENTIRFWIQDNGKGISPDKQARLFTPFNRLGETGIEGHGLGLSIVQRIIQKLNGDVGVDSQVGEGSRFWFTLPSQFNT